MARGVMVAIEGIDAVGKRTQSSLLNSRLRAKRLKTHLFSFPDYSTPIGVEISNFLRHKRHYPPEVRHLLFAANRWEKKEEVESALSSNDLVIVNRYSESNLAYGVSSGLPLDWLVGLELGLPRTDLVIVLDASPSELYGRRGSQKDRFEIDLGFQAKTRNAYLELARRFGWEVLNASRGIEETNLVLESLVLSKVKASRAARLKGSPKD